MQWVAKRSIKIVGVKEVQETNYTIMFDRIVVPLAKLAAIIKFSVAPTDIFGNSILAPFNPLKAVAWT